MSTRKQIIFVSGFILMSAFSCKSTSAQEKFSESMVSEMLKNFYTNYIKVNSALDSKRSDSLMKKYCTSKVVDFVHKLHSEPPDDIDFDIFLKSQMIDIPMIDHLTIRKDSTRNDLYFVSYIYGPNKPVVVKLLIVKEKEGYKIDHVFIPGIDD